MSDPIDGEIISIISKLNRVQKVIGGAKGSALNKIEEGAGKFDRFIDLRYQIQTRVQLVKDTIEDIRKLERIPGANPKELITCQSTVRTELTAMNDEWRELDSLYRLETKKRRSKFTPDELAARQQMLVELQNEIQSLKEQQRSGYVKGYKGVQIVTMEQSEMFRLPPPAEDGSTVPRAGGVVGSRNNNMTEQQKMSLMVIKERDAKIDDEVEEIGRGVDELGELARAARDEVQNQNVMLDSLGTKIDAVHEQVSNMNEKLKTTIEKVRNSDKICMDIFCVLVLVGMIIVLVQLSKQNEAKGK